MPLHACPGRDLFFKRGDSFERLKLLPNGDKGFKDLGFYVKPQGLKSLNAYVPFGKEARRVILAAYGKKEDGGFEFTFSVAADSAVGNDYGSLADYTASSGAGHSGGLVVDSTSGKIVGIHLMGGVKFNQFFPINEAFVQRTTSLSKN